MAKQLSLEPNIGLPLSNGLWDSTKEASASGLTLKATPKLAGTAGPSQRELHSEAPQSVPLVVSEVLAYIFFL